MPLSARLLPFLLALSVAACGTSSDGSVTQPAAGGGGSVPPPAAGGDSAGGGTGAPTGQPPAAPSGDGGSAPPPAPPAVPTAEAITTVKVAENLDEPWAMAFLPDGTMLVTEKPGRLRRVSADGTIGDPIAGVPDVAAASQGGLLDLVLSPDFANDQTLFFSYSEPAGSGTARTAVARARLDGQRLRDLKVIFRQKPALTGGNHFGSRLVFARDGMLFITLGERTRRDSAQKLDGTLGKVVRIRPDGTIPPDNPFVGRADALDEIWSYGHRNPQGAALHPNTGELWVGEHGPQGGDEMNIARAGENFGWPRITHGREYGSGAVIGEGTEAPDVTSPVYYWVPFSIAPAGMTFYTGDRVPALRGSLLMGALSGQALVKLDVTADSVTREERLLESLGERIRAVAQSPDGYPYLLTDGGRMLRIEAR